MKYLVFDTETNGKLVRGKPAPHMIQLAGILFDENRTPCGHFSAFTDLPDPIEIPKEPFFLKAGLTNERLRSLSVSYRAALGSFMNLVKRADAVVAHNMGFDDPVLCAALERGLSAAHAEAGIRLWRSKPRLCTMQSLTEHLNLPGKWGKPKWPSLDEAYRGLVNRDGFSGAHDAMVDVAAAAEVLWKTLDEGLPLLDSKGKTA